MAKVTLQNLSKDHFTCEECGGILKDFDGLSEHGGINADIPCPWDMRAEQTYGLAKECNRGIREEEKERRREQFSTEDA